MSAPTTSSTYVTWRLLNLAVERGTTSPGVDLVKSEDRAWRVWRAEARAAGICVLCGTEPSVPDLDGFCEVCA